MNYFFYTQDMQDRTLNAKLRASVHQKINEIEANKEKLLVAWIAEHGFRPGEAVVVTKQQDDGSTRMWVEKRTSQDRAETEPTEEHKNEPVWAGVLQYFPRAVRAVSRVSQKGNDKHNPGQPLHWAHNKSCDQPNSAMRHMIAPYNNDPDTGEMHLAHAAWRVLAWLEMVLWAEENDVPVGDFGVVGKEMAAEREEE